MNSQKSQSTEPVKRAAIYIAPSAYGDPVDLNEGLKTCRAYVKKKKDLKLMRIYRDEKVEIVGSTEGQTGTRSRSPLGAEGNDAWNRLLTDIETSAVEAVVIYAARTVAPTITGLAPMIEEYFIPCGIRFIDVEAEFDTADGDTANGDVESYIKKKVSEYRCTVRRKPYEKRKKEERMRICYGDRKFRGVRTDHRKNGIDRYMGFIRIEGKVKYLGTYAT